MKPKTSPTSPKAQVESGTDIERLYTESLSTIQKPVTPVRFSMGWLVFVVVVGFIAGIVGQLALIAFADRIPFLERLGISEGTSSTSLVFSGRTKGSVLTAEQIQAMATDMQRTVVELYTLNEVTDGLNAQYLTDAKIADAFVLTNDGYLITLAERITDSTTYVAVTADHSAYRVEQVIRDSATPYAFLKIDAQGLETIGLSDPQAIQDSEEIIAVRGSALSSTPGVLRTAVDTAAYRQVGSPADLVLSSERYPTDILLTSPMSDRYIGSVAFTLDAKALGIISMRENHPIIVPFARINPVLPDVLAGTDPQRPYLGIQYVLLDGFNAPFQSDDQLPESGGYIYSDDSVVGVTEGSPAKSAGLQDGDIITAIDGQPITLARTISDILLTHTAGDSVTLTVIRAGDEQKINVILEAYPSA